VGEGEQVRLLADRGVDRSSRSRKGEAADWPGSRGTEVLEFLFRGFGRFGRGILAENQAAKIGPRGVQKSIDWGEFGRIWERAGSWQEIAEARGQTRRYLPGLNMMGI